MASKASSMSPTKPALQQVVQQLLGIWFKRATRWWEPVSESAEKQEKKALREFQQEFFPTDTRTEFNRRAAPIKKDYKTAVKELDDARKAGVKGLKQAHNEQLDKLKHDHTVEITNHNAYYEVEKGRMERAFQEELNQLMEEVSSGKTPKNYWDRYEALKEHLKQTTWDNLESQGIPQSALQDALEHNVVSPEEVQEAEENLELATRFSVGKLAEMRKNLRSRELRVVLRELVSSKVLSSPEDRKNLFVRLGDNKECKAHVKEALTAMLLQICIDAAASTGQCNMICDGHGAILKQWRSNLCKERDAKLQKEQLKLSLKQWRTNMLQKELLELRRANDALCHKLEVTQTNHSSQMLKMHRVIEKKNAEIEKLTFQIQGHIVDPNQGQLEDTAAWHNRLRKRKATTLTMDCDPESLEGLGRRIRFNQTQISDERGGPATKQLKRDLKQLECKQSRLLEEQKKLEEQKQLEEQKKLEEQKQ